MTSFKKTVIIIPALLMALTCTSQNIKFGGTINMGISKVNLRPETDYQDKFRFSGNIGIFVEKKIEKNFFIGIEALWVQIEGKNVGENIQWDQWVGEEIVKYAEITEESALHISYFGLPLYLHYELGKMGINIGFQTMFCLSSSTYLKSYGQIQNVPYEWEGKIKSIKLSRIDYGARIGLDYKLSEKFRLRADYYKGRNNNTSEAFSPEGQNSQLSLGIAYNFGIKNITE